MENSPASTSSSREEIVHEYREKVSLSEKINEHSSQTAATVTTSANSTIRSFTPDSPSKLPVLNQEGSFEEELEDEYSGRLKQAVDEDVLVDDVQPTRLFQQNLTNDDEDEIDSPTKQPTTGPQETLDLLHNHISNLPTRGFQLHPTVELQDIHQQRQRMPESLDWHEAQTATRIKASMSSIKSRHALKRDALLTKFNAVKNSMQNHQGTDAELDVLLQTLDDSMLPNEESNDLAKYKRILEELKRQVVDLKRKNVEIQVNSNKAQSDVSILQSKLAESDKELERAVQREKSLAHDLQGSAQKVKMANAEKRNMGSRIDRLEMEKSDFEAVKRLLEDQVLSTKTDLNIQRELISKLASELASSSARELELSQDLESTEQDLVQCELRLQDQQGDLIVLVHDLERMRCDYEQLRSTNILLSDKATKQAKDLYNSNHIQEELQEMIESYKSELEEHLKNAAIQEQEVSELIKLATDSLPVSTSSTMQNTRQQQPIPELALRTSSPGERLFLQNHRDLLEREKNSHLSSSGNNALLQKMLQRQIQKQGMQPNPDHSIEESETTQLLRNGQTQSQRRQFNELKVVIMRMKQALEQTDHVRERNIALESLLSNSEQIQQRQKEDYVRLSQRTTQLASHCQSLQNDQGEVMREKNELEKKVSDLTNVLAVTSRKKLELENELHDQSSEDDTLKAQFDALKRHVERLEQEKDELECQKADREKEQDRLEILLLSSEEETETVKKLEKQFHALKASSSSRINILTSKIKELASLKNKLTLEIQHVERRNTDKEIPFHLSVNQKPEEELSDVKSILQKSCNCIAQLRAETDGLSERLANNTQETQDKEEERVELKDQVASLTRANTSLENSITVLKEKLKLREVEKEKLEKLLAVNQAAEIVVQEEGDDISELSEK